MTDKMKELIEFFEVHRNRMFGFNVNHSIAYNVEGINNMNFDSTTGILHVDFILSRDTKNILADYVYHEKNEMDKSQLSQYIFDDNDFKNKKNKKRINNIIRKKYMYTNDINLYSDFIVFEDELHYFNIDLTTLLSVSEYFNVNLL